MALMDVVKIKRAVREDMNAVIDRVTVERFIQAAVLCIPSLEISALPLCQDG